MAEHSWGLADVTVSTATDTKTLEDWQSDPVEAEVLAAACVFCAAGLPFTEGASRRPADCAVVPAHDCPNLPPDPEPERAPGESGEPS